MIKNGWVARSLRNSNQRDSLKVLFLFTFLLLLFGVFFLTPALRPASLLTCLNVLLLSPVVHFLERKKLKRTQAILVVFLFVGSLLAILAVYATQVLVGQWHTILALLPQLGAQVVDRLNAIQSRIQDSLSLKITLEITTWMKNFGQDTQNWLIMHLPELLGSLVSALFLVPIFSFFLLRDGKKFNDQIVSLVPKKHHAASVQVVKKISVSLSEFLRAKTIEALLVGFLTFAGLSVIGAPYAAIFAIAAGVTNIIPYLGPLLGAAPALAIFGFSGSYQDFFWPVLIVFIVVNVIDMVVIFPIFVAKLVNLSPLVLLAAVAVGQEFYGLVGMLIAVPIASILKIVYQEVVNVLYQE